MNNVGLLDELYKRDANGNRAYLNPARSVADGVWDDGVYEPVYINPAHASGLNLVEGDRVIVSSATGSTYGSVKFTNRIAPNNVGIGDGAYFKLNAFGVDIGGASNGLTSGRPSRICFSMAMCSDDRVKIVKA
ncbi:molybdopterin dinucleotide binding domain-containing protein [Geobacter sp. FeAm09]|uniref:molybdopterin dinucleotide binding domain-containing protein n=1 Tax=Geobacter sp. FeAm09 TaxID=2597769 RepID=UPI00143D50B1|nr:molybdopterin dinucleotide binding domain-containing protein [Geobacter sp. FeAm09]